MPHPSVRAALNRLSLGASGLHLARALDRDAQAELRQRGLPLPQWSVAEHAWRWPPSAAAVEAARYLEGARYVEADTVVRAQLEAWAEAFGAATPQERKANLASHLRPYQREGVDFILQRRRVLLADAMGLGKSLQALAAVEEAEAYPCVVVCPAAVKLGWAREAAKWTPWRSVQVVAAGRDRLRGADLTVLNPELLGRHLEDLQESFPQSVVLDEAHFFKNPGAQRSQNALLLVHGVPMRIALSGTPVKNRREDLVHQLRLLGTLEEVLGIYRGLLPHWWRPDKGPLAEAHAMRALQALDATTLNARLREVCMMRRTKQEVATDLPPLGRTRVDVQLGNQATYRREEKAMLSWVKAWMDRFGAQALAMERAGGRSGAGGIAGMVGMGADALEFRAHLSRLRRTSAMGKVAAAAEWAEPLLGSGERVVFFTYHKDVARKLAEALPGRTATVTGDMDPAARRSVLDALGSFDFLVATMDSTGYGVDGIQLHASHVAFLELDWTPTKHEQCEGRLHRIGQTEAVSAWYFVAEGTIDGPMMDLLESKWADIQAVVEGTPAQEGEFLRDLLERIAGEVAS